MVAARAGSKPHAIIEQQREVRYALLLPSRYAGSVHIGDAQIRRWYQSHSEDYKSPESVRLEYAELTRAGLAARWPVTEAELRAYYNRHRLLYRQPELRRAHVILISVKSPKSARALAQALAEARSILARLRAGADFSALAHEYSDDPGSARRGGDLGWADKKAYVGQFAETLFDMTRIGQITGPILTRFGYQLIRLDGIRTARVTSFEDARTAVDQAVRYHIAATAFCRYQQRIAAEIQRDPTISLRALARRFRMRYGLVGHFARTGGKPLGDPGELVQAVFSHGVLTGGHRAYGPIFVSKNEILAFRVLQHLGSRSEPLARVRSRIIATLRQRAADSTVRALARQAISELRSGASFASVAAKLNVPTAPAAYYDRTDPRLPVEVRDAVFAAGPPGSRPLYRSIALKKGGVAIIELIAVRRASPAAAASRTPN